MANAPGTVNFDVDGARKAGYSDDEIADAVGHAANFDTNAARQAGYSSQEIITHLTQAQPLVDKTPPAPTLTQEAQSGFAQPFHNLVNDVADTYHATMTRRPPTNLADAGRQFVSTLAGPAREAGDVLGLTSAPVEAVVRPAAAVVSRLPTQAYAPPQLNVSGNGVSVTGPRPMTQPQTQAAVEGALNTAFSGARAAVPAGAPLGPRAALPNVGDLAAAKNAAYKAVDDSGVHYTAGGFQALTDDMAKRMDDAGFNAGLHPKAAAMIQRIGDSLKVTPDYSPTLTQLDQLRQQIGRDVASLPDAGERRMGQIMRGAIDDFIAKPPAGAVVGADADQAASLIGQARDLNTRLEKMQVLDNLDEKASDRASGTGSGGNIDNATRQNVIRFKNAVDNLTPDEQGAVQKVIDGTPLGNVLRQIGKLSPAGNGLMLAGHLAAALPTGGKSLAVAAVGAGSKAAADAMTARNVNALRRVIANGGSAPASASMTGSYYMPGGAPPIGAPTPALSVPGAVGSGVVLSPVVQSQDRPMTGPPLPSQGR